MNPETAHNINQASQAYFRLVAAQIPTETEFDGWLAHLAAKGIALAVCDELRSWGPLVNWSAEPYYITFREYVAEHRCLEMVTYLAEQLSAADFTAWVDFHSSEDGAPNEILRILARRPGRHT